VGGLTINKETSGLLVVKESKTSTVFPLRMACADATGRNSRTPQTKMGGSDDGNAHAIGRRMDENIYTARRLTVYVLVFTQSNKVARYRIASYEIFA